MKRPLWTTSVLALACVLATACMGAKQERYKKVKSKGEAEAQKLSDCATKIASTKSTDVGAGRSVKICVYNPKAEPSAAELKALKSSDLAYGASYVPSELLLSMTAETLAAPAAPTKTEKNEKNQSNKVSRPSKNGLGLTINVVLTLPAGIVPEKAQALLKYVENVCMKENVRPALEKIVTGLKPNIDFYLADEGPETVHQMLELIRVSGEEETKFPQYALAAWPFHSDLLPSGSAACQAECVESERKAKLGQGLNCASKCARELSEPGCQSIAKIASHWLGVKDPLAEKTEAACQPTKEEAAALVKSTSLARGFVRTDEVTESKDASEKTDAPASVSSNSSGFWKTASVKMDSGLADVLNPICELKPSDKGR